jgi:hypothetical protein
LVQVVVAAIGVAIVPPRLAEGDRGSCGVSATREASPAGFSRARAA